MAGKQKRQRLSMDQLVELLKQVMRKKSLPVGAIVKGTLRPALFGVGHDNPSVLLDLAIPERGYEMRVETVLSRKATRNPDEFIALVHQLWKSSEIEAIAEEVCATE